MAGFKIDIKAELRCQCGLITSSINYDCKRIEKIGTTRPMRCLGCGEEGLLTVIAIAEGGYFERE